MPEEDNLPSDKGVDYRQLRDLLKAQQWQEAELETYRRMLEVAGRESRFRLEDLQNFSRTDLRAIDRLWVKYSNGHFGFSVQKQIWLDLGGTLDRCDSNIAKTFIRRVGWYAEKSLDYPDWLDYPDEFTLSLAAPQGHLPATGWGWWWYHRGYFIQTSEGIWWGGVLFSLL